MDFNSYAYAAEPVMLRYEFVEAYNYYDMAIPLEFYSANGSSVAMTCKTSGFSGAVVNQEEDISDYISGDIEYDYSSSYPASATCRIKIKLIYSNGTSKFIIVQKMAKRRAKPTPVKIVSSISFVKLAHSIGSYSGDIMLCQLCPKGGSSILYKKSYAIESSAYSSKPTASYGFRVTNSDTENYLENIGGCYIVHPKDIKNARLTMRVKLKVTYTDPENFPDEYVVVSSESLPK